MVDPLVTERERCVNSFECHAFRHAFEACQSRVKDEGIKENCTPEFFDLLECRDKCVSSLKKIKLDFLNCLILLPLCIESHCEEKFVRKMVVENCTILHFNIWCYVTTAHTMLIEPIVDQIDICII